jgi:protein phosphatase
MRISVCASSDLGKIRGHNEDVFLVDNELGVFLVADGMGGHGNGEIASRVAARAIEAYLRKNPLPFLGWPGSESRIERNKNRFRSAFETANEAVLSAVEDDESLAGMGSTLVALLLQEDSALVAHVGDSRAYRFRGGKFERLTQDHTWVNEQVAAGFLSETQARAHPFRNVVTRALGGDRDISVDLQRLDSEVGDLYLLCSDGLNSVLSDDQIAERLRHTQTLDEHCRELIEEANARGGPDNITVVLLRLEEEPQE